MFVWSGTGLREKLLQVLVAFFVSDFVKQSKHCYVASESLWCEVVLKESGFWIDVNVLEKAELEVVEWF